MQRRSRAEERRDGWRRRPAYGARVNFDVLEEVKLELAALTAKAGDPYNVELSHHYPHFYFINDQPAGQAQPAGCKAGYASCQARWRVAGDALKQREDQPRELRL